MEDFGDALKNLDSSKELKLSLK